MKSAYEIPVMTFSEEEVANLWKEYSISKDPDIRSDLLLYYIPMVRRIVMRLFQSAKPYTEIEDLISCGVIGLMDAFDRFDASKGAAFETYAYTRVRGEVYDYLRALDWAPVHTRIKIKKVTGAYDILSQVEGRMATDNEVATYLGISIDELNEINMESHFLNVMNLEELLYESATDENVFAKDNEIENELETNDFKDALSREISRLSEKEQLVLSLYYRDELTLKEIGTVMGLTESRVCQINAGIMNKLRSRMKYYK